MRARSAGALLLVVAGLAGVTLAGPLEFVSSPPDLALRGGKGWQARSQRFHDAKPGAGTVMPGAMVTELRSIQQKVAIAVDALKADAKLPDVLRFDFTSEEKFDPANFVPLQVTINKPEEQKYYTRFGPAMVKMARYGKIVPVTVSGVYAQRGSLRLLQATVTVSAEAKCTFGKKTYPVRIVDANGNLRLDDVATPMKRGGKVVSMLQGDTLAVDTGDGSFTKDVQRVHLGLPVFVGGSWYDMQLSDDRSALSAKLISKTTGYLKVPHADCGGVLIGKKNIISFSGGKKKIPVPPDEYMVVDFWQTFKPKGATDKSDESEIAFRGHTAVYEGTAKSFKVEAGKTVTLDAGSPLVASFTIQQSPGRVTFGLDLRDSSGAVVETVSLPGGQRPPPPKLEIHDASGKCVYKASLTYG